MPLETNNTVRISESSINESNIKKII